MKYSVSISDMVKSTIGICTKKNPKYTLLKKCDQSVKEHLDVDKIISKLYEINILNIINGKFLNEGILKCC